MNAEFSAPQIGKQDTSVHTKRLTRWCLFWVGECNYLAAIADVGIINQLHSQLETVQ